MRVKKPIREDLAQRFRAPLERVKPLTLGGLAQSGVVHIEVECEWCQHMARREVVPRIAREGSATLCRKIVRRLRCSACGRNHVEAWPIWANSEKPRHRQSALPPLAECRALLAAVPIDQTARRVDQNAAFIHALRYHWPELSASAALFVVQKLEPWQTA